MINILEVEKQRENFIKNNDIPKSVRPEILNSWIRCKNYNVDTNNGQGKELPKEEFEKILYEKRDLIQIAIPAMIDLYNVVKDTNYSIILADENAVILEVIGNEEIMNKNMELHFLKGCKWMEKDVAPMP